jgi:Cu-Zn family superoxide dismutase
MRTSHPWSTRLLSYGLALSAAAFLTACPPAADKKGDQPPGGDGPIAFTTVEARSSSTVKGQATFTQTGNRVRVIVEVSGATPGDHGLHVHENGDCSSPDANSAGGHFNPSKAEHGTPEKMSHHAGDFGNLTVGADGTGKMELLTDQISVTPSATSVVGRALVLHEKPDDSVTQPSGNSGSRIGCGVINLK